MSTHRFGAKWRPATGNPARVAQPNPGGQLNQGGQPSQGAKRPRLRAKGRSGRTPEDCSLPSARISSEKPIATVRRGIRFYVLLENRAKGG